MDRFNIKRHSLIGFFSSFHFIQLLESVITPCYLTDPLIFRMHVLYLLLQLAGDHQSEYSEPSFIFFLSGCVKQVSLLFPYIHYRDICTPTDFATMFGPSYCRMLCLRMRNARRILAEWKLWRVIRNCSRNEIPMVSCLFNKENFTVLCW